MVLPSSAGQEVTAEALELDEARVAGTLLKELAEMERGKIAVAMREARGSETEAAKALGMPRTTLINKLRRHGVE